MAGPSPWRLPSPRGGMTSVTVSGSTIEPVGSIILLPGPELQYYVDGRRQGRALQRIATETVRCQHERDSVGRDRAAGNLGRTRVWRARGKRAGAAVVRGGSDPVRAPRHRRRAEVPVLIAQPALSTIIAIPHASVSSVTGTPTRAYSPNPIRTPRDSAFSATIRFAIEPMSSRLPANVELMATRRQTRSARGRLGMTLRHSMTAGTLDTRFESTTMTALSVVARLQSEPHSTPRPCA